MFCSHKPSWVSVLTAYTTRKKASLSSLHPCFQNNQKKERKTYYFQIWKALCTLQLTIFMESCEMRERFIPKSASMLDSASSKQLAAFIHQGWKSCLLAPRPWTCHNCAATDKPCTAATEHSKRCGIQIYFHLILPNKQIREIFSNKVSTNCLHRHLPPQWVYRVVCIIFTPWLSVTLFDRANTLLPQQHGFVMKVVKPSSLPAPSTNSQYLLRR